MKENTDLRAIPQEPKAGKALEINDKNGRVYDADAELARVRAESAAPEPKAKLDRYAMAHEDFVKCATYIKSHTEFLLGWGYGFDRGAEVASKPREDSSPHQPIRHTCREPETDLDEQYCAACENLPLHEWVRERYENCIRLAGTKSGLDRDGWLNDADYFRRIEAALRDSPSRPSPEQTEPEQERMYVCLKCGAESWRVPSQKLTRCENGECSGQIVANPRSS